MKFIDKAIFKLHNSIRWVRAQLGDQADVAPEKAGAAPHEPKGPKTRQAKKVFPSIAVWCPSNYKSILTCRKMERRRTKPGSQNRRTRVV